MDIRHFNSKYDQISNNILLIEMQLDPGIQSTISQATNWFKSIKSKITDYAQSIAKMKPQKIESLANQVTDAMDDWDPKCPTLPRVGPVRTDPRG